MDHVTTGIAWLDWLLLVAAVVTALGTGWKVLYDRVNPVYRKVDNFLDDWNGQPERPGVPRQSGVMERLSQLEHNGGSSMKDQLARVEKALNTHIEKSDQVMAQGALEWAAHQHEADLRNEEIASLRATVSGLVEALPIVAKSTPPEESS